MLQDLYFLAEKVGELARELVKNLLFSSEAFGFKSLFAWCLFVGVCLSLLAPF